MLNLTLLIAELWRPLIRAQTQNYIQPEPSSTLEERSNWRFVSEVANEEQETKKTQETGYVHVLCAIFYQQLYLEKCKLWHRYW